MPLRLIGFIVILVVFLLFIGFNLGNKCDISFGFAAVKDVPVFFTVFSAFVLGMVCALPFGFGPKVKKKPGAKKNSNSARGRNNGTSGDPAGKENSYSDGTPYGVN